MRRSPLPSFNLRGRSLLPIVQGGMGVGVSAHRLAGSVAALGAVGTIASVDLRRLHPDLMEATGRSRSREEIEEANLTALEREIGMAREIAQGRGAIAVNVMRAVSQYVDYVSTAGRAGADAVVMGAGLPLDLPDIAADFPNLALMPILFGASMVGAVVGVIYAAVKGTGLRAGLPFGPFLALGAAVWLYAGPWLEPAFVVYISPITYLLGAD